MTRASDLSKLSLIGYLARDPETRLTKNDKEFVSYTVVTKTTLPPDPNGERPAPIATFHRILCFSESPIKFLSTLKKGTRVYVEANFELREPEADADPATPQGQRQIFLRHEQVRVLSYPKSESLPQVHTEESF
jgi:single-stranded DNA-binding protein